MSNVFEDPKFAVQYEQLNLDLNDPYGIFATTLIRLAAIPQGSKVLDLGSGTGIPTCRLIDIVEDIRVISVDKSKSNLEIALLKFGYIEPDAVLERIRQEHPYPQILKALCDVKDLEAHLKEVITRYRKYKDKVSFYERDASQFSDISDKLFDYVLASQVIHWFRKKDAKPNEPNLDYERSVLQQVRGVLKEKGLFAFNTTGADYFFGDPNIDDIHMYKHPFYQHFMESVRPQLSIVSTSGKAYTFTSQEVERIMGENGFAIEKIERMELEYTPMNFKEICLISGQMQIFQKLGIDLPMEQREKILTEALQYAISKHPLGSEMPIMETGVHYVVRKR